MTALAELRLEALVTYMVVKEGEREKERLTYWDPVESRNCFMIVIVPPDSMETRKTLIIRKMK
jgi:hypothetical protein